MKGDNQMKKIKIANTEFEYLDALENEQFYNGASRRTLTVTCAADAIGLDELNALLTEDNLGSVMLHNDHVGVDDDGKVITATTLWENYALKLECGIKSVEVQKETPEYAAVYADRLVFKLGKRTYIEEALRKLGL